MGDLETTAYGAYDYLKAKANTVINYFRGRKENYWENKDTTPPISASACVPQPDTTPSIPDHIILDRTEIAAIQAKSNGSECRLKDVTDLDTFFKDAANYVVFEKFSGRRSDVSQDIVAKISALAQNQKAALSKKLADKLAQDYVKTNRIENPSVLLSSDPKYKQACGPRGYIEVYPKMDLSTRGTTVNHLLTTLIDQVKKENPAEGSMQCAQEPIVACLARDEKVKIQVLRAITPRYAICDPDAKVSLAIKNLKGGRIVSTVAPKNEYEVTIKGLEYYLLNDKKELPKNLILSFGDDVNIKVYLKSITMTPQGISVKIKVEEAAAEKKYGLVISIKDEIKEKDNTGKESVRIVVTEVAKRDDILTVKKGGGGGGGGDPCKGQNPPPGCSETL